MDSGSYKHKPDVDMSGYIPLDNRVKGACRCEKCSSDPVIKRWHENDLVCKYDLRLCADILASPILRNACLMFEL